MMDFIFEWIADLLADLLVHVRWWVLLLILLVVVLIILCCCV
jgi:hypothetical protein